MIISKRNILKMQVQKKNARIALVKSHRIDFKANSIKRGNGGIFYNGKKVKFTIQIL